MTDARQIAAGFYRACSHSYFSLCADCATAKVEAIQQKARDGFSETALRERIKSLEILAAMGHCSAFPARPCTAPAECLCHQRERLRARIMELETGRSDSCSHLHPCLASEYGCITCQRQRDLGEINDLRTALDDYGDHAHGQRIGGKRVWCTRQLTPSLGEIMEGERGGTPIADRKCTCGFNEAVSGK